MNERITKIVIDTLGKEGVIASRALGYWALSDEELEKFAELLIRECAGILVKEVEVALDASGNPVSPEDFIKEHFGVK